MERKLEVTEDGSLTIYNPEVNECYHSTQGAIEEAKHTFIDAGLKFINEKSVSILEIGFGTGLNALLSLLYSNETSTEIYYESLEAYPISKSEWESLNYPQLLNDENNYFGKIHSSEWGEKVKQNKFCLKKIKEKLEDFVPNNQFNLIYFDAFSPNTQPEMWTEEVFLKMKNSLGKGGVLVTYTAKGDVKRALRAVGFQVKRLPGYGKKHHMIRAIKL